MELYYVSLVRELNGYYVKFRAASENQVRQYVAKYYGKLWCSVYTPVQMEALIAQYNCKIVNSIAVELGYMEEED